MIPRLETRLTLTPELCKEPNLTDRLSKEDLVTLGGWVWAGYQRDDLSRIKWKTRMEAAMDLAMQIQKDKNWPWPGCSNITFPLISIAAMQFSSRAYANIIQGDSVVQYRIIGKDPDQRLRDRAARISKHMSWQVMEEDVAWEEQHDRLLINVGIVGCNFVKTYYSAKLKYPVSELVMARDFVLDYWAKSVEDCARKTQVIPMYRNDIHERIVDQVYRDISKEDWYNQAPPMTSDDRTAQQDNRKGQMPPQSDEDTPYRLLEQHRLLDLDHDGYYEPYIVTIEESSKCVVKLTARWEREEDIDRTDFPGAKHKIRRITASEYYTKYGFIPAPDGGVYDWGFGTLLGPLNESVNSIVNQLVDRGTMENSSGGFLGRGVKIRGGVYTMAPWVWKRVDSSGDDLRKGMVPNPSIPSSAETFFKLLGLLIDYTDRLAGTTDPMMGVNPGQNTPAETSRNMTEQGMATFKSIYKRIWRSFKEEFKKRHKLNALYLRSREPFGTGDTFVLAEDYRSNPDLVVPSADPNIVSDGMRVTQAGLVRQSAHEVPGYDVAEVEKNWLTALKVDAIDKLYPGADKVPPLPNPKAALEQIKLQKTQMDIQYKKWEFVAKLQSERAEVQARITNLNAQTVKLLAETQTETVKAKVAAFEAIVGALQAHNGMLTQNIETMSKLATGGESGDTERGAVERVEASPGHAGAAGLPAAKPNGAAAAMGG